MSERVHIDGAYGEGGGQILRTSLALSCLTGTPFTIVNIRAQRKKPGLAPQHLTAVRAVGQVCRAHLEGALLGSQRLVFQPGGPPIPGDYRWDVAEEAGRGSAGSVTLILQTVLLPLVMAAGKSPLTIRGGTHVPYSPPVHYLGNVFLPTVGLPVRLDQVEWGWYPRGGGEIAVDIDGPAAPRALNLSQRGPLQRIEGVAVVTNLPAHIPQRMVNRARGVLRGLGTPLDIKPLRARSHAPGAGVFLTARYQNARAGFSALGRKGKASETVAEEACRALLAHHQSDASVNLHLADQLILPCAVAGGRSVITTPRVTAHLTTNIYVVRQFLDTNIALDGTIGSAGRVTLSGEGVDV
jgi:RNA 3'-terminal phosphate cyclase (ATP)